MTRTLVALTLLMLMTPAAAAWPWDPFEIRVREPHVGDLWRVSTGNSAQAAATEQIYLVEGPSRAVDRYGVERETVAYRIDSYAGGELERAHRCHRLLGGEDVVRRDLLAGWESYTFSTSTAGDLTGGVVSTEENETVVTSYDGRCGVPEAVAGRTFREGDTITLGELFPTETGNDLVSAPAVRSTFGGIDALAFAFSVREMMEEVDVPADATFEVVFAHDVPGPARMLLQGGGEFQRSEVTGFTRGQGPAIPVGGDAELPERHPEGEWLPFEPRTFDDSALGLPFPYAEAYRALLSDPVEGAADWFAAHPDAVLVWAVYERRGDAAGDPLAGEDRGYWQLGFQDDDVVSTWVVTTRSRAPIPASLGSQLPVGYYAMSGSENDGEEPLDVPAEALSMDGAMALARAAGVDDPAPRVRYHLRTTPSGTYHSLHLTEIDGTNDEEGQAVRIDLGTGGIGDVYAASFDRSATIGLGASAPSSVQSAEAEFGPLPTPGALVATSAVAAGVGLAALLVKLVLVPFYTRLRRDRLLDNPVRARLYDRIRAEPGIHLAELEEFLGIGKGATKHHVDQLVAHRLVFVLEDAGYSRCYASGHVPVDVARRMAVLRAGSHARVFELYAVKPSLSLREAARELQMSAPSVHRAKKRLEKEGLLPAPESGPSITLR